jgi:hypothetical protein
VCIYIYRERERYVCIGVGLGKTFILLDVWAKERAGPKLSGEKKKQGVRNFASLL